MMAVYSRKILYAEPENPGSDCYMCYACPDHCYISPPPPPPEFADAGKTHVSTVLILMLCVLGVSFLLLSYLTVVRNRLRNSRRRWPEPQQNSMADFLDENQGPVLDHPIWYIRTVGLPPSVIDSIGSFLYRKGDGLIEYKDCSICLSEFQENDTLRLLPKCSHAFHGGCIDTWLRSHQNCPVCRAPILAPTRPSQTDSSHGENELPTTTRVEVETDESREIAPIEEDDRVVVSDEVDSGVKVGDSVSMESSSAPAVAQEGGEGCSGVETTEKQNSEMGVKRDCKNSSIYRLIKSASCVQSLQMGPVSMKRSFSFRSQRRNSRSLESIRMPD